MSRPCSICANPVRRAVDEGLLAGRPYRDIARDTGTSKSALARHAAHAGLASGGGIPALPTVEGGFQVLLADPPWRFEVWSGKGTARSADNHYPTMTPADIMALPVRRVVAADSVLLLWATMPRMPDALRAIRAWGFTYKTVAFTWVKLNEDGSPFMGMGYYTRSNAELCLLATRGKGLERVGRDVPQVILSRRREHSRKPDGIYGLVSRLFGDVRRLEMFSRTSWPGWAAWGREVGSFPAPIPLLGEDAAG